MLFRRLCLLPRYGFAATNEAVQTIAGTKIFTKDTSHQLSLITPQEDMQDLFSLLLLRQAVFKMFSLISLIFVRY